MQQQNLATSYAAILGQMVRQLREHNGIDQGALAQDIGVSVMTVSRIESGDTVLDVPQMEKIAKRLGMSPMDFFEQSLKIKEAAEKEHIEVLQNKKELNQHADLAIISIAAIVGIIAGIMFLRK